MRTLEIGVQFSRYFFPKYFAFYEFDFLLFFHPMIPTIFYMNQFAKMYLRDKMYLSQNMKMQRIFIDGIQRTWNVPQNKSKIDIFFLKVLFAEQFQTQLASIQLCTRLQRFFSAKKHFF